MVTKIRPLVIILTTMVMTTKKRLTGPDLSEGRGVHTIPRRRAGGDANNAAQADRAARYLLCGDSFVRVY